jgi:hypothetical protein
MADDDDIEYDGDLQAFEYLNESFEPDDIIAAEVEEDPSLAPKKYEGIGDAKTVDHEDLLKVKTKKKPPNSAHKSPEQTKAELGIDDFFDVDGPVSGKDTFSNILKDPVSSAAADASNPFPLPLTPPEGTHFPAVKAKSSTEKPQPRSPRSNKKKSKSERHKMPQLNLKKAEEQQKELSEEEEKRARQRSRRKRLDLRKRREVELALAKVNHAHVIFTYLCYVLCLISLGGYFVLCSTCQARHDKIVKAREDLSLDYEETPMHSPPKKVELPKMEVRFISNYYF